MSGNKEIALNPIAGAIAGSSTVVASRSSLLEKGEEKKSSFRKSLVRIASASENIMPLASLSKKPPPTFSDSNRTNSSVTNALKSLKFIAETGNGEGTWAKVGKRFDTITASTGGLLNRDKFGECIGMKKEEEFARQLFDTLARKKYITEGRSINKAELREFWDMITDQSSDAKLQIFIDMVDKDADGKITKKELIEIIKLSASTNKLSNIYKKAEEYAAMIMEELDPNNLGYVEVVIVDT